MIVEVVAVGTELLLGQIVNTNAAVIGSALADRGHDAHFQQVVGDNQTRLAAALGHALARSDAVIVTGGIGPTQDDLTREALCDATGRAMEHDDVYAESLRRRWEARGMAMPASNLRQAEHPEGAELLPNPKGTAPGLALRHEGRLVFCLPGVPEEMVALLDTEVLPRLGEDSGGSEVLTSRLLRTWGASESELSERLDDLFQGGSNPSLAFLASAGEIKLRITAKGADEVETTRLIAPVEEEIRSRLGQLVFGAGDETIERVVLGLASAAGWTLGTAESMTGGLVSAALTSVPGSSRVVRGGLVAYHADLKSRLLGVQDVTRVVDMETAEQMAAGARDLLGVDVAVSVTGAAGPDSMEQPPGTVVVGVATPGEVRGKELHLPGDRERVRAYATTASLHLTRLAMSGEWWRT